MDEAHDAGFGAMIALRLQQPGGERRRQGQRQKQRDDRRRRDRDRELAIEFARDAGQEGDGHEDRAEDQDDRDQGGRHFVHRTMRRFARTEPLFEVSLDILDHDDGVVDDDADRQHQAEHRQGVERIAERREHREGSDQRDRDGDDGDDGRAPALQEDDDDEDDEDHRLQKRLLNLAHRFADEFGRVPDDPIFEALGESLGSVGELRLDAFGSGERIGARPLGDAEDHAILAGEVGVDPVILGAELDPRHVAKPGDRAGRVGPDDDVRKFFGAS